jgi:hypothetical protein
MPYSTQYDALQKASELFDEYGPSLEIELHLSRLSPPPAILFNTQWMRNWNRRGRPPVQELWLRKLHSNLANNLFASSCDSRRPTIPFAVFHLPGSS